MKGVVFTEFMEMVEHRFSLAVLDDIIGRSELPHGGVYTATGTYPAGEMVRLVTALGQVSGLPVPALLMAFGRHLASIFASRYSAFFEQTGSTFALLQHVEGLIHVEVRKLYPDAELPSFETTVFEDHLVMVYRSPRCMADLAEGLMHGTAEHFHERIAVEREDLSQGRGEVVRFTIRRAEASA